MDGVKARLPHDLSDVLPTVELAQQRGSTSDSDSLPWRNAECTSASFNYFKKITEIGKLLVEVCEVCDGIMSEIMQIADRTVLPNEAEIGLNSRARDDRRVNDLA